MNSSAIYLKSWEDILDILERNKTRTYIITPHENADLDAITAALLLKTILMRILTPTPDIHIFVRSIKKPTRLFLESDPKIKDLVFSQITSEGILPKDAIVFLVDISDSRRFVDPATVNIINNAIQTIAIDHHKTISPKVDYLYYRPYSSTTEILLEIAEKSGLLNEILENQELKKLALAAILTDTTFLAHISNKTFYYLHILSSPKLYAKIRTKLQEITSEQEDPSATMAILKALQRARIFKYANIIIILTHVSSYETKVANTILKLGAHLVLVLSPKKEHGTKYFRIIIRSRKLDVTPLVKELTQKLYEASTGLINKQSATIQFKYNANINKLLEIIAGILSNIFK